jgi:hypothetical protein
MFPATRYHCAFYLILLLFLIFPYPAYNQYKPFIIVINPCSGPYEQSMKDWRMPFSRHAIREWGVSQGLKLVDDRGPVVDYTAAYVGPFGSTLTISGLSRDARYRVWIDFVRFRSSGRYPESLLKIFASGPGAAPVLIAAVRYSDLNDSYYCVDIPATVSVLGRAEIRFVEFSAVPGCWGIWDIIITGGGELPRRSDIPGDESINLEIDDRIVQ